MEEEEEDWLEMRPGRICEHDDELIGWCVDAADV